MSHVASEEIIFTGFDDGWQRELPVKLITYDDGSMDLHRQTGSQFHEHTIKALEILRKRGIVLKLDRKDSVGSSGYYQSLVASEQAYEDGKGK